MPDRRPRSSAASGSSPTPIITAHLAVLLTGGVALNLVGWPAVRGLAAVGSGLSLFALSGLLREASHHRLGWNRWLNEVLGMGLGWPMLLPLSAARAFEADHHRATNRLDDPRGPLNHRAMLLLGHPVYVVLCHRHALRTLRGGDRSTYLLETVVMGLVLAGCAAGLWAAGLGAAALGPLLLLWAGQNLRIVAEHLDRPVGRFRDTWQMSLPRRLSRWLLHVDHHLEHHLRPDVRWSDLPLVRAEINRGGFIPDDQRLTPGRWVRMFWAVRGGSTLPPVTEPGDLMDSAPPRWAGRAAIRARHRQPNHPSRESVIRLGSERT